MAKPETMQLTRVTEAIEIPYGTRVMVPMGTTVTITQALGDTYTVNAARVVMRADGEGDRYVNDHGPSLRALYDLEDPKRSRFIHSSGQSGLVFSPHYADLLRPWTEVRYLPLWPQQAPRDVLQLQAR